MRFRFIDAERAGLAMPIFRLCRLLQVSVSGFYAWRNRGPSQRQLDDMVLLAHVRAAFRRSRESYGAERVHHELAENGIEVGRHRVARLMRGDGLSPKRKQKFKKTTDSQHNKAVASNLLDQNFSAEAPNEKWAADISYIWTAQGWLCLAAPSTISREVRRNAATRSGGLDYRATTAQWHAAARHGPTVLPVGFVGGRVVADKLDEGVQFGAFSAHAGRLSTTRPREDVIMNGGWIATGQDIARTAL